MSDRFAATTSNPGILMHPANPRLIFSTLILAAFLGPAGCASGAPEPDATHTTVATLPSATDEQLAYQVKAALHADPYFYDTHVEVTIEHGNIVLHGFVSNAYDLINAKKIAAKASGGRHVIDDLSIKPLEERDSGVRR